MTKDASRRRFPLQDRVIEVVDDTLTGEVLLDEALKMMKSSEKMSVASWIDLMSGKTLFTLAQRMYRLMNYDQARHGIS
jgi:Golgi phosphoprotein 3